MDHPEQRPQFIGNRVTAIITVCVIGYLMTGQFRIVISSPAPTFDWMMKFDFLSLPAWATALINLVFYFYLLWIGFWCYRSTQGKERPVVGGFLSALVLGLLVHTSIRISPHVLAAIRCAQGACASVAFFGALVILVKSPAFGKSDGRTAGRMFLFFGVLAAALFVLAALMYSFPWR
jgi:hypothetical protein